jgi:hypothetical protein
MKKHWLTAVIAVMALALVSSSAEASLIGAFSGNTQPEQDGTQGFINFAVYDTSGGGVGDTFGTGFAGMDAALLANFGAASITSSFLYLFENTVVSTDIASSSVNVNSALVTSFGKLPALDFTQVAGGSLFLGPAAAAAGHVSPAVVGATAAQGTPIADGAAIAPDTVTLNPTSLVASYIPAITTVQHSTLWGYTSNSPPSLTVGSIQDSGLAANGRVAGPNAVPEPSSVVIAGLGALGLIGYGIRRRRGA